MNTIKWLHIIQDLNKTAEAGIEFHRKLNNKTKIMGVESTKTVKRSEAIEILTEKGIGVYENDCLERLADLLYENRDSIFENYYVVEDDYK